MTTPLSILLALAALLPLRDSPDLIILDNGKDIECRVLYEDDEKVVYRKSRKAIEIERSEVADIISIERNLRTFLRRYSEMDPGNPKALIDLAKWAESNDLPGESRNLWIRALLADPENEEVWDELGGSKGRKGWRLRVRGRWYTLEELRERAQDWKNAIELPTAHFFVKTNVDPELALDIALDVERLYLLYYDTVGQAMELYPFEEVPEVHVRADVEDAPRPPRSDWTAWYQRVGNALMVLGTEANRHQVRTSAVEMLITNSFRMAQGNRDGALPRWAREGISNAFALALRREGVEWGLERGVPYRPWFEAQADDEEPIELKRLINASRGDFKTGSQEERFVRQAYTLVYFLLNAEEAKHRKPFVEYLRSAFDGKSSTSNFEKHMGVKLEDLESEWASYVRRMAQ